MVLFTASATAAAQEPQCLVLDATQPGTYDADLGVPDIHRYLVENMATKGYAVTQDPSAQADVELRWGANVSPRFLTDAKPRFNPAVGAESPQVDGNTMGTTDYVILLLPTGIYSPSQFNGPNQITGPEQPGVLYGARSAVDPIFGIMLYNYYYAGAIWKAAQDFIWALPPCQDLRKQKADYLAQVGKGLSPKVRLPEMAFQLDRRTADDFNKFLGREVTCTAPNQNVQLQAFVKNDVPFVGYFKRLDRERNSALLVMREVPGQNIVSYADPTYGMVEMLSNIPTIGEAPKVWREAEVTVTQALSCSTQTMRASLRLHEDDGSVAEIETDFNCTCN